MNKLFFAYADGNNYSAVYYHSMIPLISICDYNPKYWSDDLNRHHKVDFKLCKSSYKEFKQQCYDELNDKISKIRLLSQSEEHLDHLESLKYDLIYPTFKYIDGNYTDKHFEEIGTNGLIYLFKDQNSDLRFFAILTNLSELGIKEFKFKSFCKKNLVQYFELKAFV